MLAKEGGESGTRANVICPGFMRTPLVDKQIPEQAAALAISEDEVVKKVMLGETVDGAFTTVEDVAEVALFLAGFETNALTGQLLTVSHGWHMGALPFASAINRYPSINDPACLLDRPCFKDMQ